MFSDQCFFLSGVCMVTERKRTVLDVAKDFSPTVYKMLLSMKTEKKVCIILN